ncbi:hypothetical protein BDW68DRAFT_86526 [Aspergillus falconensis]
MSRSEEMSQAGPSGAHSIIRWLCLILLGYCSFAPLRRNNATTPSYRPLNAVCSTDLCPSAPGPLISAPLSRSIPTIFAFPTSAAAESAFLQ